jgi:hypothetical protein
LKPVLPYYNLLTAGDVERACDFADHLLENHQSPPLPQDVAETMPEIAEEFEKELNLCKK